MSIVANSIIVPNVINTIIVTNTIINIVDGVGALKPIAGWTGNENCGA